MLAAAIAPGALSCREDAELPTGPDAGPALATAAQALSFSQVSAGYLYSCGVTTGNVAYCWGHNDFAQLGDGTLSDRLTPAAVAGGLPFRQVDAGILHTCGVTTGNVAYCWGDNVSGQLGDGTTQRRLRPRRVAGAT